MIPSQGYLSSRLEYDKDTGILVWLPRPVSDFDWAKWPLKACENWNGRLAGKAAGSRLGRYVIVSLDGKAYRAHRLIWKMVTGEDPPITIDHVDGDGTNNRWENLRAASRSENARNRRPKKNGSSRYLGVSFYKPTGKWVAQSGIGGKQINLGYYEDEAEAARAYDRYVREIGGSFQKLNFGG